MYLLLTSYISINQPPNQPINQSIKYYFIVRPKVDQWAKTKKNKTKT